MPLCVPIDVYRLYLPSDVSRKFSSWFKKLGILHILVGVISIVMEAGAAVFFIQRLEHYPSIAPGTWAGVLFIVAGIFSFMSGTSGRYCNVICGMVFSILSFLSAAVVISCNAYFARKFIMEREAPIRISDNDEDTKLIPPLFILIATASCEVIISIIHFSISCATTRICFCCRWKRELRDTEIRLNYPHHISTISSSVMRTDSFQFHGAYDTVTTDIFPTIGRRLFHV